MLLGAQASIYSSFTDDEIELLLDIICKRIKVNTEGLFREMGVIDNLMSLFEEKIHRCIKNPENKLQDNWTMLIDDLIIQTKLSVKETKYLDDSNGGKVEYTTIKSMRIAPHDESHYWACFLKRILTQSDYLVRGNLKILINWHIFLNQLHKLLDRYKILLENSVREGGARPDFCIIPGPHITDLVFQFLGQCQRDGFKSYVRVAHDFIYILKSLMSEQNIQHDDGSMLVGGHLVKFLRISGNINDVLPACGVPQALECYFMRHVCTCLLGQDVFNVPFEDGISFYSDYFQNEDLLKNMEAEILGKLWNERPLLLPLEHKVSRIESEELDVARTEPRTSSSSVSSGSSSSSSISPSLPVVNTLTGLFNNFKLFKDKKGKKKATNIPGVEPTEIVQRNPLHLELTKVNLGRRGSSAPNQGLISKMSNPCATEPLTTPRGIGGDTSMKTRERSDSSPR